MIYTETDFVKKLRKEHCKGCRNEGDEFQRYCNGQSVIHCYLVKQYVSDAEWKKTIENDILNEQIRNISDAIDKKIIEEVLGTYGLEG